MNKFNDLKTVIKSYREQVEPIFKERQQKINEINSTFLPSVRAEKIAELESEYKARYNEARGESLHIARACIDSLRQKEENKIKPVVDRELLSELNTIALSGINLTEEEIKVYADKALKSGSSICCRKIQNMAKNSGFKLSIPDEISANDVLNRAFNKLEQFINKYNGTTSIDNTLSGEEMGIRMMANGNFLDRLEQEYERYTCSDLLVDVMALTGEEQGMIDSLLKPVPETKRVSKTRELIATMPELENIIRRSVYSRYIDGNVVVEQQTPSQAGAFAREYSERMKGEINE